MSAPRPAVAVLRALVLGDLLCATPALRALRAGLPGARIALVGLPWARALCARLETVDEFIEFPGWPELPEREPADAATREAFVAAMRARGFDLALQLHGAGPLVNDLVAGWGAARTAGFTRSSADLAAVPADDRAAFAPWPETGTEVERLLALTDHLGLPRQGTQLDFPLRPEDAAAAEALLAPLQGRRFVVVHPGAQLPSRRWPAERFAAVADALAGADGMDGAAIVLTGTVGEGPLLRRVAEAMHALRPPGARQAPVLDLCGATDLWTLGAVLQRAALLVSNDTGLSHVAAALRVPSVVVASGGDVARWAPADTARHRVLWHDVPCRPCAFAHCPLPGHPCATAVPAADVAQAAQAALTAWVPHAAQFAQAAGAPRAAAAAAPLRTPAPAFAPDLAPDLAEDPR